MNKDDVDTRYLLIKKKLNQNIQLLFVYLTIIL